MVKSDFENPWCENPIIFSHFTTLRPFLVRFPSFNSKDMFDSPGAPSDFGHSPSAKSEISQVRGFTTKVQWETSPSHIKSENMYRGQSTPLVLGMVIPSLMGIPYSEYINPYYKVDDPSTHDFGGKKSLTKKVVQSKKIATHPWQSP